MTIRLGSVLTIADLPAAELSALRLDGEVYRVDQCMCPIDEIPSVQLRAAALATVLPARLIVEQRTAAWVWGALDSPPPRYEVCADVDARTRPLGAISAVGLTLREVVIGPDEVMSCAGVTITSPLRTAVDIARFRDHFDDTDARVVANLMELGHFDAADCTEVMERRRKLPNKIVARHRLEESELRRELSERKPAEVSSVRLRTHPIHVVDRVDPTHRIQHPVHVGGVPHFEHETAERKAFA